MTTVSASEFFGGKPPEQPVVPPQKTTSENQSGFMAAVKDIPSDIKEGAQGIASSIRTGIQTAEDVRGRVENLETTPASGTLQTIGGGLRAGAEAIGKGVLTLGKMFTSPKTEERIQSGVQSAAEKIVSTKPVQSLMGAYANLTPETQRNIQGASGAAEGLATAFGFGPVLTKLRGTLSTSARQALEASDNALATTRKAVTSLPVPKTSGGIIDSIRFNLSEIDPQVDTILKRSNYDEVNRYFQQAHNSKINPAKDMPFSLANDKAQSAYDVIDKARSAAIRGKKAILANVASERVPGNVINDVMSRGIQRVGERFGATIDADGSIVQAKGRTLQLDASDTKLVTEYFKRLNSLGVSPSAKQVDDFVDWAQGQLYKQSKSLSKFEVASDPVIRELQSITGDLNTRLKDVVGGGYGEVNARIAHLIELQDELSNALGADGRKGTTLMKRLFSPSGDETRRIFEEIRKETGIDLVKEATLAKFAMESVGDTRQTSLLKSLDLIKETSQLDLTKPLSIINFIRERADMDGQELANEILRRVASQK